MRAERPCEHIREDISARLDEELDVPACAALDEHLSNCAECRAHERELRAVRRALRAQPAESVPDLSGPILERVAREHGPVFPTQLKIGAIAAAAAALLVAGIGLPWTNPSPDIAAADDIAAHVRAAARSLTSYRATYRITERGWNPKVDVRRFSAEVRFEAPEKFRLDITDETLYPRPGLWPENDVELIANERRYWIKEPVSCPSQSLPSCALPLEVEQRTVIRRQPFDGSARVPTDIILPLETLTSSSGFKVLGLEEVAGRSAYHVELAYRQAVPLVTSLQPGGSWRDFGPFDRVDLWIDRDTWFPLAFEVRSPAQPHGEPLLSVKATSFSKPEAPHARVFRAPVTGSVRDGGFAAEALPPGASWVPELSAGLDHYRSGVVGGGQAIRSYADGMTWLKVVRERPSGNSFAYRRTAERVPLSADSVAYYEPAGVSSKRRVDLYGKNAHVYLESNLARARLLSVARSIAVEGRPIPSEVYNEDGFVIMRVPAHRLERIDYASDPSYLPAGYELSAAFQSKGGRSNKTLTAYYRRLEAEYGFGIRITQSPTVALLAPAPEELVPVDIGRDGRWSRARGELEWFDGSIYRAIRAPSLDLTTVLRIGRGLR